jgi:hypothetical protein
MMWLSPRPPPSPSSGFFRVTPSRIAHCCPVRKPDANGYVMQHYVLGYGNHPRPGFLPQLRTKG